MELQKVKHDWATFTRQLGISGITKFFLSQANDPRRAELPMTWSQNPWVTWWRTAQESWKMLVRLYRSGKHASFVLNCYDVGCLLWQLALLTNTTIMMTRPKVGIQVREKEILRAEKKKKEMKKAVSSSPSLSMVYQVQGLRNFMVVQWSDSAFSLTKKKKNGSQSFSSRHKTKPRWSPPYPQNLLSYCWLRDTVRPLITHQGCKIQDSHGEAWTWCPGQTSHREGVWSQARINPGAHPGLS